MDNNNNTPKSVDDYSEKCGLPSSQGGGTNNINYPDFNKEYGKPVTLQDIQKEVKDIVYSSGMQFSINELSGTLDNPEDVIDIAYSTNLFPQAPVLIAVESKNSIDQEAGKDAVGEDIKRSKKSTKIKTQIVARMYIREVVRFEEHYHVSGFYRTLQNQIINFDFIFDINKYRENFRQAFIDNKVDCFNDKLNAKDISRYLKILIEKKEIKGTFSANKTGFFTNNDMIYFASVEFCEYYHLPKKINKHFKFYPTFMPDIISENFVDTVRRHEDKLLYMLLNIIRIAGIYSTLLNISGTAFCKIVVIKGDYNKISPYLQVYGRMIEKEKELSVNMKSENAVKLMSDYKDDIFLLNDDKNASDYKRKNGEETIRKIAEKIAGYNPDSDIIEMQKYPFVTCVVSDRLGSALDGNSVIMIDASTLTRTLAITSPEVEVMHRFDEYMITHISSNWRFIYFSVDKKIKTFREQKKFKYSSSNHVYAICMEIYSYMSNCIKECSKQALDITKEEISDYIEKIIRNSEEIDNFNTIEKEFIHVLNEAVLSDNPDKKFELVYHSKLSGCYGETEDYPVIYRVGDKLYIPDEEFNILVSRMNITDNNCHLRKALYEKGLLYSNENLKTKVRLFGKKHSGDIRLTVLSDTILSEQAKKTTVGGNQNYTPCIFSEEQIFLGYDKNGNKVGLEYSNHLSAGLTIVGKNTLWTSTLADLIALQFAEKNKIVFFIDEEGHTVVNNMRDYGFDEEVIEEIVYETDNLNDIVFDEDIQEIYVENDDRRIFSLYGDYIEKLLIYFLEAKKKVLEKEIILVLHTAGAFERKVSSPFYRLMKDMAKLNIIVISVYQGAGELRGRNHDIVNKSDIKMIFNEGSAEFAEQIAKQNYLKPYSEFGELIFKQAKEQFILTGILKDDEGSESNGRFIQLKLPSNDKIAQIFNTN
ncbi:MAG: hypothetical protein NC235_13350 [Clostridiales bacterium]|nr:hypothetical protein [Clostridiales bacterium]